MTFPHRFVQGAFFYQFVMSSAVSNLSVLNDQNLFGISNVNSYYWVTDVTSRQWAVPNYLTGRQINGKITVEL